MLVGKGLRCRLVLEEGGHRDKLGNTLCGSVWTIILPHTSAPTQNTNTNTNTNWNVNTNTITKHIQIQITKRGNTQIQSDRNTMKYVQSIILSTTQSQPTLVPEAPNIQNHCRLFSADKNA